MLGFLMEKKWIEEIQIQTEIKLLNIIIFVSTLVNM